MKNKLIIAFALVGFSTLLFSCKKEVLEDVTFDVTTDSLTYNLKDTVLFKFTGNPDNISLYSGESGNVYDYRNRTVKEGGEINFSFQSRAQNADCFTLMGNGSLRVLVSTNFPGIYSTSTNPLIAASADSALVNAANWTDVTSRFNIPSTGIINTFYNSNVINIADLVQGSTVPLNIAFKFSSPTTPTLGANGITIGSLVLTSSFPDGSTANFNVVPGGSVSSTWKIVRAANTANSWATSTTQLKFTSSPTTDYSEDWAISNAFYPRIAQPDKSIAVKNISNPQLVKYAYKFKKAGTYKVVFVASNNRVYGQNEVAKEITLTIKP